MIRIVILVGCLCVAGIAGAQAEYFGIRQHDIDRIHARIAGDQGIRAALIGDSLFTGVGARVAVYGEYADRTRPRGIEHLLLNMTLANTDYFLPLTPITKIYQAGEKGMVAAFPWANAQLVTSNRPHLVYTYPHKSVKRNTVTLLYLQRYNACAPVFDLSTAVGRVTVDTYKPSGRYGNVTVTQAGWDLAAAEMAIPTDDDTFTVTVENFRMLDRGNGVQKDGTAVMLGFYYGHAIEMRNLAVASTTLTDPTVPNVVRGVTTETRFTAANACCANVFFICMGTNDSKRDPDTLEPLYTSPERFGAELTAYVNAIQSCNPEAVIILVTAPRGEVGSQYQYNVLFNQAMRGVAAETGVSCFDVEALLDQYPRDVVFGDGVHPNATGYQIIGNAISGIFGFTTPAIIAEREARVTSRMRTIVTDPARLLRMSFFNATGGTTVADISAYMMPITLSADAQTMKGNALLGLNTLMVSGGKTWRYVDADELSFGNGAGSDQPFSIVLYGSGCVYAEGGNLFAKRDSTDALKGAEYQLYMLNGALAVALFSRGSQTAYIGRRSLTVDVAALSTVVVTYDGSLRSAGIKIYVNGVRADAANFASGMYAGMTPGPAPLGNFRVNRRIYERTSTMSLAFTAVIRDCLTAQQVAGIHNALTREW